MSNQWEVADPDETWVLMHGDGWVPGADVVRRACLRRQLAELEARRDALAAEMDAAVDAARASAYHEAHREGLSQVQTIVDVLRAGQTELVEAAALAALDVAAVLTARAVASDPACARTLVMRALEAGREQVVISVRVHPEVAEVAGGCVGPTVSIHADDTLGHADVVIETERGRVDGRIATWCALFMPDVHASILANCGDADAE